MPASSHDSEKLKRKLQEFAAGFPFFKLIGFELLDLSPGWSKTAVTLRDDLRNPNGVMHGGVLATLVDAGITQAMLMTDIYQQVRETKGFMTTVDLRMKYLRPLTGGTATCEATIPHLGRRVCHAAATVVNDDGKVVATGDSIVMITLGDRKPT